ncbi:MAG: hypothetical protein J7500_14825 [Sphingomonas sp.]|nr:hypothetical protein [Sphingomonas sp.]
MCGSAASAQSTASGTVNLKLTVPVVCRVTHQPSISAAGAGYRLGELHEYCNSARGYVLALDYAPGTMKGAVISLGDERVVLDGSGHAVVSRVEGPRIRDREIYAEAGPDGFDTDRLQFEIQSS